MTTNARDGRPVSLAALVRMLAEHGRICHDNAREYGHQYREQCDRLRAQIIRDGHTNVDEVYTVLKPKDDGITTAMSRWRWWRDEAIRVNHELRTELALAAAQGVEMDWAAGASDAWYVHTLRESLAAARTANEALHKARRRREAMEADTLTLPTIPTPRRPGTW